MRITAVEIAIDYLLDIGALPEVVLPREMVTVDTDESLLSTSCISVRICVSVYSAISNRPRCIAIRVSICIYSTISD